MINNIKNIQIEKQKLNREYASIVSRYRALVEKEHKLLEKI